MTWTQLRITQIIPWTGFGISALPVVHISTHKFQTRQTGGGSKQQSANYFSPLNHNHN